MNLILADSKGFLGRSDNPSPCIILRTGDSPEQPEMQTLTVFHDSLTAGRGDGSTIAWTSSTNATKELLPLAELDEEIERIFRKASDGSYEDSDTDFSEKLSSLVIRHGDIAVACLAPFIIGAKATAEVAAETLRTLSHIEAPLSYNFRLWLVLRALQSSSSWIRDAASLSIESMDDPTAIPHLENAISKEPNAELKQYMNSVLKYLQRKR